MNIQKVIQHTRDHEADHVEELKNLIAVPSISSDPEHAGDVRRCAELLREWMEGIGLENVRAFKTSGHPIVYGEWLGVPGKPTVLIYGHYDVQPVDPVELWETPPFEASVRNGRMFGRGTADDKGQVHMHLKALESWMKVHGSLPVNVKFIVEGEEEVGSENLGAFLGTHRDLLSADLAVISDTPMFKKGLPSICYGLRGLAYFQLDLEGSKQDLHSGSFGGAVKNPVHALAEILAGLKDDRGRVAIDGFYDDVDPLAQEEREALAGLPFDEEAYRQEIGAPRFFGEQGYTVLESLWCRPTLDVCGIWGGFTGKGAKTVIPSSAHAKVSMRLVSRQDPDRVAGLFESHIQRTVPPEVKVTITRMHGGLPYVADTSHPAFQAARRALKKGFDTESVFIREGGSIPFVEALTRSLGIPCLLVGFGLPDENAHSPNEWLDLENYHKGIESIIRLYDELSGLS
ncbi:MAG: dipeptidase [Fidelibacterota bacterium]